MSGIAGRLTIGISFPTPAKGKVDYGSRLIDPVERLQGSEQYGALLRDIPRFAERMTKGPAQVNGSWRLHLFGVIPNDRDADGGDPGPFNFPLDQPYGLIAEPSGRGQQH